VTIATADIGVRKERPARQPWPLTTSLGSQTLDEPRLSRINRTFGVEAEERYNPQSSIHDLQRHCLLLGSANEWRGVR
jgi:hypothetical protein